MLGPCWGPSLQQVLLVRLQAVASLRSWHLQAGKCLVLPASLAGALPPALQSVSIDLEPACGACPSDEEAEDYPGTSFALDLGAFTKAGGCRAEFSLRISLVNLEEDEAAEYVSSCVVPVLPLLALHKLAFSVNAGDVSDTSGQLGRLGCSSFELIIRCAELSPIAISALPQCEQLTIQRGHLYLFEETLDLLFTWAVLSEHSGGVLLWLGRGAVEDQGLRAAAVRWPARV